MSKYDEHIAYVQQNVKDIGLPACAKHLETTVGNLKELITNWRKRGIDIPYVRKAEVGDITVRTVRGKERKFIKTEKGWRRMELLPRGGARRMKLPNHKPPKEQLKGVYMKRAPKPEPTRYPDREVDMSKHRWHQTGKNQWTLKKIA
jgi:hypothetical protein